MAKKLILSEEQKKFLNQEWEADELCSECDCETYFGKFNPMETEFIACEHCGKKIHPCTLCDGQLCGVYETCQESIQASLLYANEMWDEQVNGAIPEGI